MMQGAIFDMDGVLVDNVRHHLKAWKQLGRELGKELSDEAIRAVFGQRNSEMLQVLLERELGPEESRRFAERKEELYREAARSELGTAMVPGLLEFLQELKKETVGIALATSGPEENARFVLEGLNIASFFDVLVTGREVERGKPHPDIFLLAARRLGLPAEKCVVFEDSESGIQAALRAGCRCVALATTHSPEELKQLSPARVVRDFTELQWRSLADAG